MAFNHRLNTVQRDEKSLLCVGIDPDIDRMPQHITKSAVGVHQFCSEIIQNTLPHASAYKLNSAFFEVWGSEGFEVLEDIRNQIPANRIAIYDVKRGDIGNTAKQYAKAAFETLGMDAVTLNPYMGTDAIAPFTKDAERGVFILCYTSNPGSQDIQQQMLDSGEPVYIRVARKVKEWNVRQNAGLVVGATKADTIKQIRDVAPELPILAPGVGAQGGDLEKVLEFGYTKSSGGIIIPISRSILYAGSDEDYAKKSGEIAAEYNRKINEARPNG